LDKSAELYGVRDWGAGYFDIAANGDAVITPFHEQDGKSVSLMEIVSGLHDRGFNMPVLLRISNILDSQISRLHDTFYSVIEKLGYQGKFRGVYPIKVNQQEQVVQEVSEFGSRYDHGLEVGSKAELLAAISFMQNPDACLICNGYKDEEFVDLGLYALKVGIKCFLVIEMPSELQLILERAEKLGVRPLIGVRIKLSSKALGHWTESGGDRSIFGLSTSQVVDVVDVLREKGMLDCLQLLH
jgi:arginine decarboxylase